MECKFKDKCAPTEFEIYSVYWRNQFNHVMMHSCTALNKEDALTDFRNRVDQSQVKKITKIVKGYGMPKTTAKQALAHQYRSCIGACKMAEKNLYNVKISPDNLGDKNIIETSKRMHLRAAAVKHVQNAQRDIKDLFTRLGLKIK
jgi:hypothetical protein